MMDQEKQIIKFRNFHAKHSSLLKCSWEGNYHPARQCFCNLFVSGELKYPKQAENASSLPLPASQLLAQRDIKQPST